MNYYISEDDVLSVLEDSFNESPPFDIVLKIFEDHIDINSVDEVIKFETTEEEQKKAAYKELEFQLHINYDEIDLLINP